MTIYENGHGHGIRFDVTIQAVERDHHWIAKALETGIIGAGPTKEGAEEAAEAASRAVVKGYSKT